jgi:hypothetical protein
MSLKMMMQIVAECYTFGAQSAFEYSVQEDPMAVTLSSASVYVL